ncbi:MAG: antitoxin Xre/MbcA/ParS toxin-binding domain-containing protein [Paracraurococcus sp.]
MTAVTLSQVLGLRLGGARPPTALMTEVEKGFPLTALDRVAHAVAPDDAAFPFRMVARATLARRRKAEAMEVGAAGGRLSAEESARVARLAEVWALACEVWGGEAAARAFLFRPHMLLDGRRPVDVVLANEFGRPLVEGILGRLQYGSAV